MKCKHVQRHLQSLVDKVLRPCETAKLEEHLAVCSVCRREFEAVQTLDAALSAEPSVDPPGEMAAAIVSRALARARTRRRILVPGWLEVLTFAGLALALVATTLVVLAVGGTAITLDSLPRSALGAISLTVCVGLGAFGYLYYSPQT